jgi:hypothetical protein
MAIRVLPLLIASVVSGCASQGIFLPRGVYLNKCMTHVTVEQSRPASCMTWAEYRTARKKAQHSRDLPSADKNKPVESIEEVNAVDSRSKVGIP